MSRHDGFRLYEFPLITLPTLFISRRRRRNAITTLCTSAANGSNVGRGVEIAATSPVRLIKTTTSVICRTGYLIHNRQLERRQSTQ